MCHKSSNSVSWSLTASVGRDTEESSSSLPLCWESLRFQVAGARKHRAELRTDGRYTKGATRTADFGGRSADETPVSETGGSCRRGHACGRAGQERKGSGENRTGEKLFFDGRLVEGTVACSKCHDPALAFFQKFKMRHYRCMSPSRRQPKTKDLGADVFRFIGFLLWLIAVPHHANCQSATAAVNGTVRDHSGAVISEVKIIVANTIFPAWK